jgi:2-amino-4-hydroxy-6-hydroxymethyldihydropteridine diphosphokinase
MSEEGAAATALLAREQVVTRTALLGLGSNVGDRRAHLQAALDGLGGAGVEVLRSSPVYDTDPVGEIREQASFLNACLLARTTLGPLDLLDAAKRLERGLGREAGGPRHGPRVIDVDILLVGEIELAHERMKLPHEQLLARRFVLVPALELDMDLATPGGVRLADALQRLPLDEGVRWAGEPLRVS